MATLQSHLPDPADSDDDLSFQEEGDDVYNMRELMDQVYSTRDIIFTVPDEDVDTLKQGLIVRKGKDNAKLKRSNLPSDGLVLSFLVTSAVKNNKKVEGHSDVRVKLGPKKSVRVKEIRIPSDEL